MGFKLLIAALVTAATLVAASAASASVRFVSVTSPNSPGDRATLFARVSSPRAKCSLTIRYRTRSAQRTTRLAAKRAVGGRLSWRWTIAGGTATGRWPIQIDCGSAGRTKTSLVVRR
jgi:hypothetical protein